MKCGYGLSASNKKEDPRRSEYSKNYERNENDSFD
jgi:hypothetical protein